MRGKWPRGAPIERLLRRVDIDANGCWLWTGPPNPDGYGQITGHLGQHTQTHVLAYTELVGSIPDGLQLDHLCRVRLCCNPDHLKPKTIRDNLFAPGSLARAALNAAKTHCPRGHPYEGDNLRIYQGMRVCRTCRRDAARRVYRQRRGLLGNGRPRGRRPS